MLFGCDSACRGEPVKNNNRDMNLVMLGVVIGIVLMVVATFFGGQCPGLF